MSRPASHRTDPLRRATGRAALWLGAVIVAAALGIRLVPLPRGLFDRPAGGLEIVDRNGLRLRTTPDTGAQFNHPASEAALPPALVAATLAAEDARFREHGGVDLRATARAAFQWARHRRIISGASTITQQLIKLAQPRRRTLPAKAREAIQAIRLEQIWSKDRILAAYVNRLDYGNLNRGIHAAAWHYFRKPPGDLSLAESAFLAGIPQSPTRLNPRRHFAATKARQEWILGRMESLGWIQANERADAAREPIRLAPTGREFDAPHFTGLLLEQLGRLESGRLQTTLDLALNRECERVVRSHLASLRDRHLRNGAVVIIDNRTSELLALVGSEDFFAPGDGQVNGALAARSAGSTLKPFTYLLALEQGGSPGDIVADIPAEFATPTGVFRPLNYSRRCHGPVRWRIALANSLNIPAVRLLESIGGPAVLQQFLTETGFSTLSQSPEHYGLGLTIGNAEINLLELANAYAGLARLGNWRPLQLTARDGAFAPIATRDFTPPTPSPRTTEACWLIADILADNTARALEFGLDSALRFDFPVACKTGTSTGYRDNWAVGFTPEFTVAVWVGNFDGAPMERVSGVTGAAPILHDIVEHLHQRRGTTWFARPAGLTVCRIDPFTGRRAPAGSAENTVTEYFFPDRQPPGPTDSDRDPSGRIRLGPEYGPWLAGEGRPCQSRFVCEFSADPSTPLRVLSPVDGSEFVIDPDLPAPNQRLTLRANRDCEWHAETLGCTAVGHVASTPLRAGRHRIVARDRATGDEAALWIEVRRL